MQLVEFCDKEVEYWFDSECYQLLVSGHYEPVIPGRYCGKPEDCYPDEGGNLELTEIWVLLEDGSKKKAEFTPAQVSDLEAFLFDQFEASQDELED